jgi:Ser/Thr protein kinase RdoA (MazF antagonist)
MNDPDTERSFPTDKIFHSIRLEPYLEATARIHPDVADALYGLVLDTQNNRIALVHGDISPKNIMIGPEGPVFLDAECAWYGDPAFDLAFCLNHLLLKGLYRPDTRTEYAASFETMTNCYLDALETQYAKDIEFRAARLLPGLLLARVDGKSPVEYITKENDKNLVRRFAKTLLCNPLPLLQDVCVAWQKELNS